MYITILKDNDITACSDGDVKLEADGTPLIFWDKVWSPICGHYFWDNQYGAKKFCQHTDVSNSSKSITTNFVYTIILQKVLVIGL